MKTTKCIKYYTGIIAIIFLLFTTSIVALADSGNRIVHKTIYGSKYHSSGCSYLNNSDIRTTLYDAVITDKLGPCSRCNPPRLSDVQTKKYMSIIEEKKQAELDFKQKELEKSKRPFVFIGYFAITLIIFVFVLGVGSSIYFSFKRIQDEKREKKLENMLYNHYFSMYAFYTPLDFIKIPTNSFLKDNLPVTKGRKKYGDYTYYTTNKGECFHQNSQCSKNLKPINYACVYTKRPCKRCVKDIPEIQWYLDIIKIQKIKKEYNIP